MELSDGWEVAGTPAGAVTDLGQLDGLAWVPARVPGTVASALGDLGDLGDLGRRDLDAGDWWFRTRFERPSELDPGAAALLELDGIATEAEVFLNRERVLTSSSMWSSHRLEVTDQLADQNELVIVCRALNPLLEAPRRPRARWRTRVVRDGNLRWHRTMVFGRSPGFAPGPAPVGPWRPVRVVRRGAVRELAFRTAVAGEEGTVSVSAVLDRVQGQISVGEHRAPLRPGPDGVARAELRLPAVARWWPHTHGDPELHELRITAGDEEHVHRVGFRTLEWADDVDHDGLALVVNGVPVFARGAVWTPPELISMAPSRQGLARLLGRARDAGMNMLRVVGTGAYESPDFYELCDELGILVWQDLMFANLDYPLDDPGFRSQVEREVGQVLELVGRHPSLTVLCGNSEVEQQPAMMGLDPALGRHEFWDRTVPGMMRAAGIDAAYVRSTPCGGSLPFRADRGVAHYFGVSGYFEPVEDVRRAEVRFAAECLAFANVPDVTSVPVHHPDWKRGVPRDAGTGWDQGAGWDFDDVRDHYLKLLFGCDPLELRRSDHARYLELSRFASAEVMSEVIGEWRRAGSPCRGALVLWLKDMLPGAGLGVIDAAGHPKVAYHHLRRAFAPIAVWMSDEGINGVQMHVANDRGRALPCRLRVALYRRGGKIAEAAESLDLSAHETISRDLEQLLGFFTDAAWAYHFGPPTHDAIVASLHRGAGEEQLISQAFLFPAGRPLAPQSHSTLGLRAVARETADGAELTVRSEGLAYGVRIHVPGYDPDDDAFSVEPGASRQVRLVRQKDVRPDAESSILTALNLVGSVKLEWG